MRIAIVGTGGVGGYFGGRLAHAGEDVVFIARGDHLQAMQDKGLKVNSINGDFTVPEVQVTDDTSMVGVVDVVLIGIKTWQLDGISPILAPLMGPETCVLPLQNGLEMSNDLIKIVGVEPVLGGTCVIYSYRSAPGCIEHVGLEPSITIGELNARRSRRTEVLRDVLSNAGIPTVIVPDIRIPVWEKFLILRWGLIGAITRAPAGVLRSLDSTRSLVEQAGNEVIAVASALDITLARDINKRQFSLLDSLPYEATTSLQRDVMDGVPSELDAQANAMLRLGRDTGVDVPLHQFLYTCLEPMERLARGLMEF